MRLARRRFWPAAVLLLVLPACGAGDEGGLTREAWRERAASRCAAARSALAEATRTKDGVARAAAQAAVVRELTADLRALEPPADDRDAVRETLDVLDGAADLAVQGVEARRAGDEPRLGRLRDELETLQERSREVASASEAYGLNDCMAAPGVTRPSDEELAAVGLRDGRDLLEVRLLV
jgi:hypothetical protein